MEPQEPSEEEVVQVAGENYDWFDMNRETLFWLIKTVQRLVPLDEQAVEEWNILVQTQAFDNLTRPLGKSFCTEAKLAELRELAKSADINEGEADDEQAGAEGA